MKNKMLAVALVAILIVSICSIPVMAGWEGYTPNFGFTDSEYALLCDENLRSEYSTTEFIHLLDNAYELGLFGGSYPIAVVLNNDSGLYQPIIICASPVSDFLAINSISKSTLGSVFNLNDSAIYCTNQEPMISLWMILPTGDLTCVLGIVNGYTISGSEKLYLMRNPDKTVGVNGWYWDDNDSNFAQFYSVDGNVNNSIVEINDLYNMALQNYIPPTPDPDPDPDPDPPVINNFTYLLDIPSIITAIPNGAKQIIQYSLDFDIFGINVAGLLSVLIVVALVAYGVKWLMSR